MQSLDNLPTSWLFPLFVWFSSENSFDFLVHVPYLVFLRAESEIMADGMWIRVMPPQRIDNRIHHLVDSSLANIVILQFLLRAVCSSNDIQCYLRRLAWYGTLVFLYYCVADRTNRVDCSYLCPSDKEEQGQHKS